MKISSLEYQRQIFNAQKTLQELNKRLLKIEGNLQIDPNNTLLLREVDKICLDITITENELEHALSRLSHKERTFIDDGNLK